MNIFYPDYAFDSILDITLDFLNTKKITTLLLDVDNTLTTHNHPEPIAGALEWIEKMQSGGITLMIVSNNTADRVTKFAGLLKLDFVASSQKPLSKGIKKAIKQVATHKENVAMVGDQLFTDVLGGNLYGCNSILVKPIELEQHTFFKAKRKAEEFLLKNKKTKR